MGKKRTKIETEKLRNDIASLYLQGVEQVEIGKKFEITQQAVSYHLKKIRKKWLESALRDFDELKSQELAKIDNLEREYWDAWIRSQEDKEMEEESMGKDGETFKKRREGQVGDPRFLVGVEWCINKRCEILGIDAPTKIEGSLEIVQKGYVNVSPDQWPGGESGEEKEDNSDI
jgi:predicted transcriptional regulator